MAAGDLTDATIVFDLDGTLVDTAPDLVRALNQTLDLEGLPSVSVSAVRRIIGQGARAMIERAATLAQARFSSTRLDQLTDAFVHFYKRDIAGASSLFPGALAAMDALTNAGATLAVCTNKRTALSRALLEALSVDHKFAAIVGADAVANRKPHPEHFTETVARAGGQAGRALMVGDSSADVRAAKDAGAPVVVVSFGYNDAAPHEMGADAVIAHFSELAPIVRGRLAP